MQMKISCHPLDVGHFDKKFSDARKGYFGTLLWQITLRPSGDPV